jgi:hypothetical protein
MKAVINFPNRVQLALWQNELVGQISDGKWENSKPNNHWEFWGDATAVCNPSRALGLYSFINPRKNNYSFKSLIPVIGDRMLGFAKMSQVDSDNDVISLAEYIQEENLKTLEQIKELSKEYTWLQKDVEKLTQDTLNKFWALDYDMKDLRKDLSEISSVITIQHYMDF